MGYSYVIKDQGAVHFVTFTVHQWINVFTKSEYVKILIDSLKHCQKAKGLEIYSWVIMSNHCHFILKAQNEDLSDIIRDFKKFTAKRIYSAIKGNMNEKRRDWLLSALNYKGNIWFWQRGYHGEEITTDNFYDVKANYIHMNPVKAGIVEKEEDYLLSSAGDFYGIRKGPIKLDYF
ncbi:REP-associated tyrosine transposase [Mangrovivirga cuniculi]|uniref:Transposase n=1 Tax=Mangrovivirga cuniculi TaxID=2715131 RepID=A0A4D7JGZ9_9BACT|nr:transposase [Mangrovivirga cuniculi]QCK13977.1 transposase [Mangrovivirga cuniculi]